MSATAVLALDTRLHTSGSVCSDFGTHMNDGIRKIDFVLVYKGEESNEEMVRKRKYFEENLEKEGVELETERIDEKSETLVFVKLHVPWKILCLYADELQIKAPLWLHDKPLIRKVDDGFCWSRLFSNDNPKQGERKTRLYGKNTVINWPFKRKRIERFAIRDESTFFTEKQRIEIAYEILQKAGNDPNEPKKRGIGVLLEHGVYETAFPLHDCDCNVKEEKSSRKKGSRRILKETWANWKMICRLQPLFDVRTYFGEKIGFYFAFMDCYTRMLLFPAVVGLLTFLIGIILTANSLETSNICDLPAGAHGGGGHGSIVSHESNSPPAESHGHEIHEVTTTTISVLQHKESTNVAGLWMCPICKPPGCDAWEMFAEGCFQYTWAFRLDNPTSFFLSSFTLVWAIIFLKIWKRREASLAADWDTEDAEEHDLIVRPEFEERAPSQRKNPITQEMEPWVPLSTKILWMGASVLATVICLLFAGLCLVALVLSRIALYKALKQVPGIIGEKNIEFARWLIHGLIFVVVLILENAYHSVAHKLTDYECPRTESKFMTSLLWKIFIFELLNDFVPIGYAAWVKGRVARTPLDMNFIAELCDGGCMGEVTELVAVLLLARLVVGNLMEIGIPFLKNSWKRFRLKNNEVEDQSNVPQWLKDYHLNEVEMDGVYDEYMEMMIQFSFIVLFIPALPVAAFVCFLNNIAEIRVDAINMLQAHRRPLPIRVSGIGIWNRFLDIIIKTGIICNAALLAFTSDNIPRLYYSYIQNPSSVGYDGFTKFSLSKVPISSYPEEDTYNMRNKSIKECYYPDFRNEYFPYNFRDEFWEILSIRMMFFAVFMVVFFIIMWFVNTCISDVPSSVTTRIKRRVYVVTKAMEAEAVISQTKWAKNNVWAKKTVHPEFQRDVQT